VAQADFSPNLKPVLVAKLLVFSDFFHFGFPESAFNFLHLKSTPRVLTVNSCIKVRLDLQADKSPVVVKGP
jgi:hypothetical protein